MLSTNQTIAVAAILLGVGSAFVAPIVFYEYKIDSCARHFAAQVTGFQNAPPWVSRMVCIRTVNGAPLGG
jgi:hypothetical protein